jgi:hypothetical protein
VKYEDITKEPKKSFKKIFEYLDLDYANSDLDKIKQKTYYNPKPYQDRLSKEQIKYIKNNTKKVWEHFYLPEDW